MKRETSTRLRFFPFTLHLSLFTPWLLGAMLLGLSACAKEPIYQQQSFVFGTMVEVTIYGESEARAKELAGQVLREFDRLHRTYHAWKPGPLEQVNAAFARGPGKVEIEPEMAGVIENATRLSEQSGGLFNPAVGHLIKLWGFQSDEFKPVSPDPQDIARLAKANPRMSDIVVEGNAAYSRNPAVKLDLGGYAKGYALDLAARYLRSQRVQGALVNIGGNIIAVGSRGGRPWRVGVQHPRKAGPIAALDLHDGEAIGTSGDYQRYFLLDGKRYSHIIDPRTGYPAQGVQAVTVLVPPGPLAGALSDAASKPAFIAGAAGWRAAVRNMGVEQAMLIDENGEIHLTAAMKKRAEFPDQGLKLHEVQ